MIKGRQISSREAGFVGSHGNEKLRPFMVAFFRANSSPTPHISHVIKATDGDVGNSHEEEDEDEDEDIVRSSRVRRQTRKNRKRSKDINEDYGSWNPYTGTLKFLTYSFQGFGVYLFTFSLSTVKFSVKLINGNIY